MKHRHWAQTETKSGIGLQWHVGERVSSIHCCPQGPGRGSHRKVALVTAEPPLTGHPTSIPSWRLRETDDLLGSSGALRGGGGISGWLQHYRKLRRRQLGSKGICTLRSHGSPHGCPATRWQHWGGGWSPGLQPQFPFLSFGGNLSQFSPILHWRVVF